MRITSIFPLKKNNEKEHLPEVTISNPKKAVERLEEQNHQNILLRREEILNNATTTTKPMNETAHGAPITINNDPVLNTPINKGPSILEEQDDYNKDGFNFRIDSEEEEVHQVTHIENKHKEDYINPFLPAQSNVGIGIEEDLDEELEKEPDNSTEQEYDPFDESMSETGITEVEVTFIDGKTMRFFFKIGKTKFEEQWLDEIYSIGIFTAKDIYGNLITLTPKGKDNVAFNIKEGTIPNA
ncbi:hypothetical protein PVA17_21585 [Lysinibacillus sp. CNPSo 3705]|uniref:hypothetical protein n=1 Tax=Lysinibacillus sp. CNPSo 3705 TaxID=3028148 RepID=UPI0023641BB8|nr:hypothetical protein [Lysinibacillus sp. CNPSo 3705]MDD1505316.1 hypothetical protein [Lysinibacillus sp. CNPSo 3705]